MCMEDVRLGRATGPRISTVNVATTKTPLVPYAPDRVTLIISAPTTGPMLLSGNQGEAATAGLRLPAGGDPLVLDIQHHGALVTMAWYAAIPGGAEDIGLGESFLDRS